ncbi:MAG: YwiB family protein [Thermincolia bacterium]
MIPVKKDVLVTVKGTQVNDLGEENSIQLITRGDFFFKNQAYYIIYNESEISGMEGTTTSLKAEPERITLNRMGSAEQKQVFEVNTLNISNYITPFATWIMGVIPSKVEVDLTDIGGSINLEYELNNGTEKVSDNKLSITVKEV